MEAYQFTTASRLWECEKETYRTDTAVVYRHKNDNYLEEVQVIITAFEYDLPPMIDEDVPMSEIIESYWGAIGFNNTTSIIQEACDEYEWNVYTNQDLPDWVIASTIRRTVQTRSNMVFYYYPERGLILNEYRAAVIPGYREEHGRLPGGLN